MELPQEEGARVKVCEVDKWGVKVHHLIRRGGEWFELTLFAQDDEVLQGRAEAWEVEA